MGVRERIEAKLETLPATVSEDPLAALALRLADMVDGGNSPTSISMNSKELRATLEQLYAMAPPEKKKDVVDELNERRSERRRAAAQAHLGS